MRCGSSSPRLQSTASGQRKAHRERPERPLLHINSPFFPAQARTLRDRGAYAPPHLTTSHHRQHTQANSKHHANQTHAAATCAAPSLQPPHGVKKRRAAGAAYAKSLQEGETAAQPRHGSRPPRTERGQPQTYPEGTGSRTTPEGTRRRTAPAPPKANPKRHKTPPKLEYR